MNQSDSRATVAWGGKQEGEKGGVLTGQGKNFESDGYVHYFDFDDGFTGVYIRENLSK